MKAISKTLFLAAAILLLGAGSAMAYTVSFGDSATTFQGWVPGDPYGQNSQDVVGIPQLLGGEATITNTGGSLTLTSVTFYITSPGYQTAYNELNSGDLFINTGNDTTWDYVAVLNGGAGPVNVYEFNHDYSSSVYELSDSAYSGSWPATIRHDHPVNALTGELGASAGTATFSGLPAWPDTSISVIEITGLNITIGDLLTFGYTVSCANDVIFETVSPTPLPSAVWLLGSGLLGLIGLRRTIKG